MPGCQVIFGCLEAELEVIKRGKEKHNPDGTGDTVKKYL